MARITIVSVIISTDGLSDADPNWMEEQRLARNLITGEWDWVDDTQHPDGEEKKAKAKRSVP